MRCSPSVPKILLHSWNCFCASARMSPGPLTNAAAARADLGGSCQVTAVRRTQSSDLSSDGHRLRRRLACDYEDRQLRGDRASRSRIAYPGRACADRDQDARPRPTRRARRLRAHNHARRTIVTVKSVVLRVLIVSLLLATGSASAPTGHPRRRAQRKCRGCLPG